MNFLITFSFSFQHFIAHIMFFCFTSWLFWSIFRPKCARSTTSQRGTETGKLWNTALCSYSEPSNTHRPLDEEWWHVECVSTVTDLYNVENKRWLFAFRMTLSSSHKNTTFIRIHQSEYSITFNGLHLLVGCQIRSSIYISLRFNFTHGLFHYFDANEMWNVFILWRLACTTYIVYMSLDVLRGIRTAVIMDSILLQTN